MLEHVYFRSIAVLFYLTHAATLDEDLTLILDVEKPIAVTSDKFLSLTLDPAVLSMNNAFDSHNKRITNMGKALSPAYFRLAGINDNSSIFHMNEWKSLLLPESEYSLINNWAKNIELNIVISIPPITNNTLEGLWNFKSIDSFIQLNDKAGYDISFQLGYECLSRCNVPAEDLGKNVVRLRKLLSALPRYSNSVIAGPDVVTESVKQQQSSLRDYLNTTQTVLSAITWHPDLAGISLSSNAVTMHYDNLETDKEDLFKIIGPWMSDKEFWIAESRQEESKNEYFGGIIWTRRLGLAAKLGAHVIMRQLESSLIFEPTPDYWVSVLHKMLVGREALNIEIAGGSRAHVQFYCQCTKPSERYEKGSVTIFGFNVASRKVTANLKSTLIKTLHAYVLSPGYDSPSKMFAETVLLNGQPLSLLNGVNLPKIDPLISSNDTGLDMELPVLGIAFWVLPDIKVKACMRSESGSLRNVAHQNEKLIDRTNISETKPSDDNQGKLNPAEKSEPLKVKTSAQSKLNHEQQSEEEIRVKLEEYKQRISEYARGKKLAQGTTPEKPSQYETTSVTALISKVEESAKLANGSSKRNVANFNNHKTPLPLSRLKRGIDNKSKVPKKYKFGYSEPVLHTDVAEANAKNKRGRRARRADDNLYEANSEEHIRDQKRDTNIMKISQVNASSVLSSLIPDLKDLFQSGTEEGSSDKTTNVESETERQKVSEIIHKENTDDGMEHENGNLSHIKTVNQYENRFSEKTINDNDEGQSDEEISSEEQIEQDKITDSSKAVDSTTLQNEDMKIGPQDWTTRLESDFLETTTEKLVPMTTSSTSSLFEHSSTEINQGYKTPIATTTQFTTEIKSSTPQTVTTEKMIEKINTKVEAPNIHVIKEIIISSTIYPQVPVDFPTEETKSIPENLQSQDKEISRKITDESVEEEMETVRFHPATETAKVQDQRVPNNAPENAPINSESRDPEVEKAHAVGNSSEATHLNNKQNSNIRSLSVPISPRLVITSSPSPTPEIESENHPESRNTLRSKKKSQRKKKSDVEELKLKLRQKRAQLFVLYAREFLNAMTNDRSKRQVDDKLKNILEELLKIEILLLQLDRLHRERRSVTFGNSKVSSDWSTAEQKIFKKDLGSLYHRSLLENTENRQNNVAERIQTILLPAEFIDYLHTNGLNEEERRVKRQDSKVNEKIRASKSEMKAGENALEEFLRKVLEVFESSREEFEEAAKQTRVTPNDENNEKSHRLNGITSRLLDAIPKVEQQLVNNGIIKVQDIAESVEKIYSNFNEKLNDDSQDNDEFN